MIQGRSNKTMECVHKENSTAKQQDFNLLCVLYSRVTQQSPSWLPVLEKHDIPIVVGVGVSLAFIFITVTFYSVVQKNEPAPTSRAGQRSSVTSNICTPVSHLFLSMLNFRKILSSVNSLTFWEIRLFSFGAES